mmetsp:Transcript_5759/g.11812  ORF Transcript_5759/g.11812 Transcript_5759/m.11812 type:complete len:210 (-) Transcript_5759:2876-3505(-)
MAMQAPAAVLGEAKVQTRLLHPSKPFRALPRVARAAPDEDFRVLAALLLNSFHPSSPPLATPTPTPTGGLQATPVHLRPPDPLMAHPAQHKLATPSTVPTITTIAAVCISTKALCGVPQAQAEARLGIDQPLCEVSQEDLGREEALAEERQMVQRRRKRKTRFLWSGRKHQADREGLQRQRDRICIKMEWTQQRIWATMTLNLTRTLTN